MLRLPNPWYLIKTTADEFLTGIITLGHPLDVSLVGVFNDSKRGSRQDIELPFHRDGEYSKALAQAQGGYYTEPKDIDIVGLYCLKQGIQECFTSIKYQDYITDINIQQGEALIFDNKQVEHARKGSVGDRLLLRVWIKKA